MTAVTEEIVRGLPLHRVARVDVGLEGDWSGSVAPVWRRGEGFLGFDAVVRAHPRHRPSVELYFDGGWVGVHCFRLQDGAHVFDEAQAAELIRMVESA